MLSLQKKKKADWRHDSAYFFFAIFGPIKYTFARNSISSRQNKDLNGKRCIVTIKSVLRISYCFSDQNKILRPLSDANYTPIIIVKWSQNLCLTTKTVKNGCLDIYGPLNA